VLLQAERPAEPEIDTPVIGPDPGVSTDGEEAIRAATRVAVDVGAGPDREGNSAPDEDARAESRVGEEPRQKRLARAGPERALKNAAQDEVVPDVEGRKRPLGEEPRREGRREGRVEIGLVVN